MDAISGAVGKKAVDEAITSGPKIWRWLRQSDVVEALTKENKILKEKLDLRAEFEKRKSEMVRRQEDDNMYRDSEGRYYCGLCADDNSKFVGLTNQSSEGSYYCRIHEHTFETEEHRLRRRQSSHPQPIKRFRPGRHGWMGQ